jgi:hypothetical protein
MRRQFFALVGICCFGLIAVAASPAVRADLVLGYDAVDVSSLATKTLAPINGAGVTGSVMSAFALIDRDGGGTDYTWSGFPTGASVYGQGFNFSLTSTTAYNLTSLELSGVRSSVGPISMDLWVDTGSGFVLAGTNGVSTSASTLTYSLALSNVTSAAFQLRGYSASNSGANATFSLVDAGNLNGTADLVLNGTIAAVPEASPIVFGAAVCGVIGAWRFRQVRRLAEARI